jgi:hypothetical protein
MIAGDAARRAVAGGWALPLDGGSACTGCEIWQRRPDGTHHEIMAAADLARWLEGQPAQIRDPVWGRTFCVNSPYSIARTKWSLLYALFGSHFT